MATIVSWYDKKMEKLRQLSKCQLLLLIAVKFLAGVAIGLLLATLLPVWTWWIFLVVAAVIAIPLYTKIFVNKPIYSIHRTGQYMSFEHIIKP